MGPRSASPAVVALGGGHGLSASLAALRLLSEQLTAVVTVADDGGSSGRLRAELGVLPPGDLRMALSALCDDSEWGRTWRDLLQHRFSSDGELDHHAVGNLIIVALWQILGDTVEGLDWVGRLLGVHGRVLPMSSVPLEIEADCRVDGELVTVRGQSRVAKAPGPIEELRMEPSDAAACAETIDAVRAADWVVLGPGSWYTSVITHLLVPDLAAALHETSARRCVTLNLEPEVGETDGLGPTEHLELLHRYAPDLRVDAVVADPTAVDDTDRLARAADRMGARLLLRQVSRGDGSARHDPLRLASAYQDAFDGFWGDVGTRA
ncbi:gluconeogenesis factor YvcK family protein [Luteimicrobium sp. DT211]|uniref:gluconeogenesis factor YvcK family protein n=1 Tax=Luteimicrobium sp. DT211 TaxID=3393412 RepID=UPI003CEE9CDD